MLSHEISITIHSYYSNQCTFFGKDLLSINTIKPMVIYHPLHASYFVQLALFLKQFLHICIHTCL
jgi:hypothetical protein